jgi:hypothetical protein
MLIWESRGLPRPISKCEVFVRKAIIIAAADGAVTLSQHSFAAALNSTCHRFTHMPGEKEGLLDCILRNAK